MKLEVQYSSDASLVGREYTLDPTSPVVTIGRDPSNTIVLPTSSISRRHARLEWTTGAWVVHDTASTSGVRVNDVPVQQATLRSGDRVWVGDTLLQFDPPERIVENFYTATDVDGLTKLSNKRHVLAQLAETPRTVIRFDIDRFKRFNDRFGHLQGDQVLVELAARLRAESPPGAIVGRVGGDDFVVAVPVSPGEARELAAVLRARIAARAYVIADWYIRPAISIGVAAGLGPEALLRAAEDDLDAKRVRTTGTSGDLEWSVGVWTRESSRTVDVAAGAGPDTLVVSDGAGGHATGWLGARFAVRAVLGEPTCVIGAADVIPDEWGWAGAMQSRAAGEQIYTSCVAELGDVPADLVARFTAIDRVLAVVPERARISGTMVGCTALRFHGARITGAHVGRGRARVLRAGAAQLEELVVPHYLHTLGDRVPGLAGLDPATLPRDVLCNGLGALASGGIGIDGFETVLEPDDRLVVSSSDLGFPDDELVVLLRGHAPLREIEQRLAQQFAEPDYRVHPSDVGLALLVRR